MLLNSPHPDPPPASGWREYNHRTMTDVNSVRVAVVQMQCTDSCDDNCDKAEEFARAAAKDGANIVLLQELFASQYFCTRQNPEHLQLAQNAQHSAVVARFQKVAAECGIVLPVSFFEQANNARYNSAAIVNSDGAVLGVYRKSHIPDGPGYCEKFYFNPGDTGFRAWQTNFGVVGVGVCWDQWFPEAARAMALAGADILLYPTAIGSEPSDPALDSSKHWRRVMQGHAGANLCALAASNRVGEENANGVNMKFYGTSFIAGDQGEILAEMGDEEGYAIAELNLKEMRARRQNWGIFRDRRPDLYQPLLTLDGGGN